jgi:hypothetical protein
MEVLFQRMVANPTVTIQGNKDFAKGSVQVVGAIKQR